MFHLLLLISITFISIIIGSSSIFCTSKKQKGDGKTTSVSSDDPPSKKCNTKDGLLGDDPDLKSLRLKEAREQQQKQKVAGGGEPQSPTNPTSRKPSTVEGTILKSFDDGTKKTDNNNKEPVQTATTSVDHQPAVAAALDKRAPSKYAGGNNKTAANDDGVSMLAMAKVDKEKLPPKMKPKETEIIAQDDTQRDDSKSKSKSQIGNNKSNSKKAQPGAADGKKKKNLEDMLDAMMDKTQGTLEDENGGTKPTPAAAHAASPVPKTETKTQQAPTKRDEIKAAPKTKFGGEAKTQIPTKLMDLESVRSERNKKASKKTTQKSNEKVNERRRSSSDAMNKKIKPPSKRFFSK